MSVPKPTVLQIRALPAAQQSRLEQDFEVRALGDGAGLSEWGPQARAIVTGGASGVENRVIEACSALELITVFGVGYDRVDLGLAAQRGVAVTNTPDVLTDDVADLGIAMMMALSRGIVQADQHVRSGMWANKAFGLQQRVSGQRVGILGLGRIGQAVARRLAGFGMQISYSDLSPVPGAEGMGFQPDPVALAAGVDVLFVTLAASAQTRHIVGAEVLDALGPKGMLVNISRASNVDEAALIDALETGRLGSAALDVFEGEPHINPRFLELGNVLLQPHHASATHQTREAMGELVLQNLTAHFSGKPLLTPVPMPTVT